MPLPDAAPTHTNVTSPVVRPLHFRQDVGYTKHISSCQGDMVATTDGLVHLEPAQLEDEVILDRVRRRMLLPGAASSHDDFASLFQQCRGVADAMLSLAEARARDLFSVTSSPCGAR